MSETIILSASVRLSDQANSVDRTYLLVPSKRLTRTATGVTSLEQTATTTAAALNVGNLTSVGLAVIRNMDSQNNLLLGIDVSGTFHETDTIPPGQWVQRWLSPTKTHQVKSAASTVKVESTIFQRDA